MLRYLAKTIPGNGNTQHKTSHWRHRTFLHREARADRAGILSRRLGFTVTFQGPTDDDIFFGIVERDAAMIMMKAIGVEPIQNYTRDIKKGHAPWDVYLYVPDPDALAAEFASRNVTFLLPLQNNQDNLRGFEIQDADGYVLYFGRPNN